MEASFLHRSPHRASSVPRNTTAVWEGRGTSPRQLHITWGDVPLRVVLRFPRKGCRDYGVFKNENDVLNAEALLQEWKVLWPWEKELRKISGLLSQRGLMNVFALSMSLWKEIARNTGSTQRKGMPKPALMHHPTLRAEPCLVRLQL